jgi:hypothetical protein
MERNGEKHTFHVRALIFNLHMPRRGREVPYRQRKQEHNNMRRLTS